MEKSHVDCHAIQIKLGIKYSSPNMRGLGIRKLKDFNAAYLAK